MFTSKVHLALNFRKFIPNFENNKTMIESFGSIDDLNGSNPISLKNCSKASIGLD